MPKPIERPGWTEPLIHPTYLRVLVMALRQRRIDVDRILAGVGLTMDRLLLDERYLSLATVHEPLRAAAEALGPDIGLALGGAVPVSSHGAIGAAMISSRNLGEALEVLANFGFLRNRAWKFTLRHLARQVEILLDERVDLGDLRRVLLDILTVVLVRMIEAQSGAALADLEIHLPYAPPRNVERYRALVPGEVRFGARRWAIRLPKALLRQPSVAADPVAHQAALRACRREADQFSGTRHDDLARLIRQRLASSGDGVPRLATLARDLGLSARTAIRRLRRQGTTYQALLDDHRREIAAWHLRHGGDTVEAIAAKLGYADASNFSRSFRRWFGTTPKAFRLASKGIAPPESGTIRPSRRRISRPRPISAPRRGRNRRIP